MKDIASMEQEAKRQNAEAIKSEKALLSNYAAVCKTPQGRKVMNDIFAMAGLYNDCFTGNSETFYREGSRSVALQILEKLNAADPNIYISILKHNLEQSNA